MSSALSLRSFLRYYKWRTAISDVLSSVVCLPVPRRSAFSTTRLSFTNSRSDRSLLKVHLHYGRGKDTRFRKAKYKNYKFYVLMFIVHVVVQGLNLSFKNCISSNANHSERYISLAPALEWLLVSSRCLSLQNDDSQLSTFFLNRIPIFPISLAISCHIFSFTNLYNIWNGMEPMK